MSGLTPCNFCSLQRYRQRYKGHDVTVERSTESGVAGWWQVHVDGRPIGAYFAEISDGCAC